MPPTWDLKRVYPVLRAEKHIRPAWIFIIEIDIKRHLMYLRGGEHGHGKNFLMK